MHAEDIVELVGRQDGPCVSIFMPTHQVTHDGSDALLLRHLLDRAEQLLLDEGLATEAAGRTLAPGRALLADTDFWAHQSHGLAVFLSPGRSRIHQVPLPLTEDVVVDDRYHVRPLLDLVTSDGRFHVLALSQHHVRLLACTRETVVPVPLPLVPQGLAEALKYDDLQKERQFHIAGRGGGNAPVIFHGQGIGGEVDKGLVERYLREVDHALHPILAEDSSPLVLAGVRSLTAMFRQVTRVPTVTDDGVDGNPDEASDEQLHDAAWPHVAGILARARARATDGYAQAAANGAAASDPEDVVAATAAGRVDVLVVPAEGHVWGTVDPDTLEVRVHRDRRPGDCDLLDLAVAQTLQTSGAVFAVPADQVPGPGPMAALLRY